MKTEDFIRALSADLTVPRSSMEIQFAVTFLPGLLLAVVLFALTLGPRPDLAAVLVDQRFIFKFLVTLLLAFSSQLLIGRLARPGAPVRSQLLVLALVPAVLAGGIAAELIALPRSLWMTRLVGTNSGACLLSIPFFAFPMLIAALVALSRAAPTSPGRTGAVAGLLAGAIGAAIYAAHCPDDSPLFVATWYSLAIAFVAGVGAIAGRFTLRW